MGAVTEEVEFVVGVEEGEEIAAGGASVAGACVGGVSEAEEVEEGETGVEVEAAGGAKEEEEGVTDDGCDCFRCSCFRGF